MPPETFSLCFREGKGKCIGLIAEPEQVPSGDLKKVPTRPFLAGVGSLSGCHHFQVDQLPEGSPRRGAIRRGGFDELSLRPWSLAKLYEDRVSRLIRNQFQKVSRPEMHVL